MVKVIGNPIGWGLEALVNATRNAGNAVGHIGSHEMVEPTICRLTFNHLRKALKLGLDDFMAMRSDVVFLVLVYPFIGITLVSLAVQASLVHLVFPLAAGLALIGPITGIGLYEMSKRRAEGRTAGIGDAFKAFRNDTIAPVMALGGFLVVIFIIWVYLADRVHAVTMGGAVPQHPVEFLSMVLTTEAGWAMIVLGTLVGFVLAALVLVTTLVSFQMLVDRPVGLPAAVVTSYRVAKKNPLVVAGWGAIIAALLVLGTIPALLGLIVVLPVLGHASWHFYRMAVAWR